MKNTKIQLNYGLGILAILAMGALFYPDRGLAAVCGEGGCNYTYITYGGPGASTRENNPKPVINSISPDSSNIGEGTKTITIEGEGFVRGSIARINDTNRSITFIDDSHLLMQVTGNDMYQYQTNGGFYITVFNGAPGGGYSNAAFFTVSASGEGISNVNDTSTNFMDNTSTSNSLNSNLGANALSSSSRLYSGLIEWVFLGIMILLIVILVRRILGGDKKYLATPLKHD